MPSTEEPAEVRVSPAAPVPRPPVASQALQDHVVDCIGLFNRTARWRKVGDYTLNVPLRFSRQRLRT